MFTGFRNLVTVSTWKKCHMIFLCVTHKRAAAASNTRLSVFTEADFSFMKIDDRINNEMKLYISMKYIYVQFN